MSCVEYILTSLVKQELEIEISRGHCVTVRACR